MPHQFQDIERFEKLTQKKESLIKEMATKQKDVCGLCTLNCNLFIISFN